MSNTSKLTRRSFLKSSLAAGLGLGAAGLAACAAEEQQPSTLAEEPEAKFETFEALDPAKVAAEESEQIFVTPCRANCYQACKLEAHVRDGKIVRMSPHYFDDYDESFELYRGGCLKGMSLAARTYNPNRIKYPMRRVGERGAGEWEKITWDEAIKDIAENFTALREKYGTRSIGLDICSGNGGMVNSFGIIGRFANVMELTYFADSNDHAIGYGCDRVMGCGIWENGNEMRAILDSRLIVIWGSNVVQSHPQDWRWVARAHNQGAKLICIDPQFSTTAARCDQFIPIEPGTDPLLALGLLRIVMENDWMDRDFIAEQTNAFQLVRDDNGKILKTSDLDPSILEDTAERCVWDNATNGPVAAFAAQDPAFEGHFEVNGIQLATCFTLLKERVYEYDFDFISEKTGIDYDTMEALADEYAHSSAAGIYFGYGPNMYTNGHLTSQAYTILASLTGQMGDDGKGLYGLFNRGSISGGAGTEESMGGTTAAIDYSYITDPGNGAVSYGGMPKTEMFNVFRDQKFMGEDYPLHGLITFSSNAMSNQCGQNHWFDDVLPNLEYWVVSDIDMTDAAEYADLVLPASFWLEYEDGHYDYATPFLCIQEKAIDPLYESKPDHEVLTALMHEMGMGDLFPEVETEYWLHGMLDNEGLMAMGISLDELREKKTLQVTPKGDPWVRGKTFPWGTDDALLHIYCEDPAPAMEYGQDWQSLYEREHLPYWRESREVYPDNPLREKYPLVFLADRCRFRTHTQFFDVPALREIDPEPYIRMNPQDANARGLKHDQLAEAYNDHGRCVAKVRIDNGVRPGCIAMPKGWQRKQFVAGGYQELTQPTTDVFINNFCYYDSLCDVRAYKEA